MAPASDPEAPTTGYETIGADTRDVVAGCKTIVMRLYRDRAVVLRQHKLGEADRIVTLLTRDHGLVRAVAKGVRRTRSKFGARLEPFAHIEVQLHPGRNLDIVTQVVSVDAFATDIVADYGRYTCGCAILETAERLAGEERAPAPALHRLTVGALRAVADGQRPRDLLLDAYLLRAMGIAGWAPALTECARCATPGPHRAFHIATGPSRWSTATDRRASNHSESTATGRSSSSATWSSIAASAAADTAVSATTSAPQHNRRMAPGPASITARCGLTGVGSRRLEPVARHRHR